MNKKGFTMAESLLALIFISFSGLIVAASIVVSMKSYKQISIKSNIDVLQSEYQKIITLDLENSTSLDKSIDGKDLIESNHFKCYGYYGSFDGVICFVPTRLNGENITATENRFQIVPMRNHYIGSDDEKVKAEIDYKYDGEIYYCSIHIIIGDDEYVKSFNVFPNKNIL